MKSTSRVFVSTYLYFSFRLNRKEAEIVGARLEDSGAVHVEYVERKRNKLYLYHVREPPPDPPEGETAVAGLDSASAELQLPIPPGMCCLRRGRGNAGAAAASAVDRSATTEATAASAAITSTAPGELPAVGTLSAMRSFARGADAANDTAFEMRQIIRSHKCMDIKTAMHIN